jgi:HUS1 checkpoint protein
MRFRSEIVNIHTFTKLTASLGTLGDIAWLRLDDHDVRFTVIPEKGTQVWAVLSKDTIFDGYTCQSAAENNTINLEVPLAPLQRALKSAQNAITANIRLTKKDNIPLLSLTIKTSTINSGNPSAFSNRDGNPDSTGDEFGSTDDFRKGSIDFARIAKRLSRKTCQYASWLQHQSKVCMSHGVGSRMFMSRYPICSS